MFAKTLKTLSVPEERDTVFVSPEFSDWLSLLLDNKAILQDLPELCESRKELLGIAKDYTEEIITLPRVDEACENIIVTGHQANWHHCGILAKNLITSGFAQDVYGCGICLVLDHDISDTAMVLPKQNPERNWYFERIEIETNQRRIPLEFRRLPQEDYIKSFLCEVTGARAGQFCGNVWPRCLAVKDNKFSQFHNIADLIIYLQAVLNEALGLDIYYLPISRLAQSDAFINFSISIMRDAANFANVYNNGITRQIAGRKISQGRGIQQLEVDKTKGLVELPFWLAQPDGKRASLYTTIKNNNEIAIGTVSAKLGDLDSAWSGGKADQLKGVLRQSGYRLRPKAVSLTLFVRLFLADWFVHGVGGAFYESVTDYILENYYRIEGLRFGFATATAVLPLGGYTNNVPEVTAKLKQQLRGLKYNPEKFIELPSRDREPVKSLMARKNKLIEIARNTNLSAEAKKSAWMLISGVNKRLLKYVESGQQEMGKEIKFSESCELSQKVRNWREYFFGLFSEEMLASMSKERSDG